MAGFPPVPAYGEDRGKQNRKGLKKDRHGYAALC
jgi:hypothetical protein